jgi:outer membrane protein insertion porin family
VNLGSGAATNTSPVDVQSDTTLASITPTFVHDRINSPFRPSRGRVLFAAAQIAGQVIGGDNTFVKPILRFTQYFPAFRRSYFALHTQFGAIIPFGDGVTQGSQIEDVPVFERFYNNATARTCKHCGAVMPPR